MLVVTARVVSKPETRTPTRDALLALEGPTRAEAGCLDYTWFVSATNPDVFTTIERWDSAEALEAHMATPHVQAVLAAAGELVAEPPVITSYDVASTTTR